MKNIKFKIELITYLIITLFLIIILFWAISSKEGFHEDEMFSYGASNSSLGNTFLSYARVDIIDTIIKRNSPLLTFKNYLNYKVFNKDEYEKAEKNLNIDISKSIWRTREDAIEYLQIDNIKEAIDFATVYWNTAKDVHPPLFYFLVHIISILFFGHFSKYIIFLLNLLFFISTIFILRKIFVLVDKRNLSIPNLVLYGASIGAISTVMFQRMYMMLTFFTILFLYINLKIVVNDFELNRKLKKELIITTILGFLTQYNFCFYALFLSATIILIAITRKKKINFIKKYILQFIISALIGIIIFIPSIYHIFFSYRGMGAGERAFSLFEAFEGFLKLIFNSYSISFYLGIVLSIILVLVLLFKFKYSTSKILYIILIIPTFLTFIMITFISPYKSLRYIMYLLPIISMIFVILMDDLVENKIFSEFLLTIFAVYLSINGLLTNPINYLYKGYNNYIKIAEENKNDRFVLVMPTIFSQIQDVPEFKIYKESLIINPDKLEDLKELNEFKEENEFILGVKNWMDKPVEEVLKEVMEFTGYENYELIYDSTKSARLTVYKIYK